MTQLCEEQRPLLIAYLKNELAPLERALLESHLARCVRCTAVKQEVGRSLEAAKVWKPELSEERMDHLVARLSPYIAEAERGGGSRVPFFALGAVAAAAAAVVLAFLVFAKGPSESKEPADSRASKPSVIAVSPTPHIKLVASAGWDGRVDAIDATRSEISMSRGFAVVEFEGGQGRTLTVRAPGVTVEVVGTRFFVEVLPGGKKSVVGVTRGKVRAVTASRLDEIAAGQSKSYAVSGELASEPYRPVALGFVGDPAFGDERADAVVAREPSEAAAPAAASAEGLPGREDRATTREEREGALDQGSSAAREDGAAGGDSVAQSGKSAQTEHRAVREGGAQAEHSSGSEKSLPRDNDGLSEGSARRADSAGTGRPHRSSARSGGSAAASAPSEATALLAKAEDRARSGDLEGALSLYRALTDSSDPKLASYRALARYETARILGFKRDDRAAAASILRDLAKNGGEVATEAAFALCELDLASAPCRAAECLRGMAAKSAPRAVAKEARALLERWGLDAARCPAR